MQTTTGWRGSWAEQHKQLYYVDCTVGGAGHSKSLLEQEPRARLLCVDRDDDALAAARARLPANRAALHAGTFGSFEAILKQHADFVNGAAQVHGILADIGVSSWQLDSAERGFSLRRDGPLDMRMTASSVGANSGGLSEETTNPSPSATPPAITAAHLVNMLPEGELVRILREYGEEPFAGVIARAIVRRRLERPIERTTDLASVVFDAVTRAQRGKSFSSESTSTNHPATRTFQALRIAVNGELRQLEMLLAAAPRLVVPGGVVCIITFHSLEDRMVKNAFNKWSRKDGSHNASVGGGGNNKTKKAAFLAIEDPRTAGGSRSWNQNPATEASDVATWAALPAVTASPEEIAANPRSRSATLRILERVS